MTRNGGGRPAAARPRRSRWTAFLDGVASIFDLYGAAPPRRRVMSDAEAFRHDWEQVGQDLWWAFAEVARQDDGLRLRLAKEAGEKRDRLLQLVPEAEKEDPRAGEALRAAADRQEWFRTTLLSGGGRKKP